MLQFGEQDFIAGFQIGVAPTAGHEIDAFGGAVGEDDFFAGRGIDERANFFAGFFV